ncbi:MAG: hypothetical protein MUC97_09240 [Bernardetiaceae bacterium]|jgi:hypothetical protein|nr:hypothetical protein [Bernardetiaceae bacterium]
MNSRIIALRLVIFALGLACQTAQAQVAPPPTKPNNAPSNEKGVEVVKKATETYSFGVQFINNFQYDGECSFYTQNGQAMFSGVQTSKTDDSYLRINGRVKSKTTKTIVIVGTIEIKINDCVAEKTLEREFVFTKHGNRSFWRIQNPVRSEISSDYECALYIDINH